MNNEQMIINMPFPEQKVREIFSDEIQKFFNKRFPKKDELIPRIESAKILNQSLPTFDKYAREGFYKTTKIGGKVFMLQSEIDRIKNSNRFNNNQ